MATNFNGIQSLNTVNVNALDSFLQTPVDILIGGLGSLVDPGIFADCGINVCKKNSSGLEGLDNPIVLPGDFNLGGGALGPVQIGSPDPLSNGLDVIIAPPTDISLFG